MHPAPKVRQVARFVTDATYPMERTPAEFGRLRLQAESLAFDTGILLDRIGVGAGWRCLDLGCGAGGITDLLSARAGPTGRVVGLDPDAASLAAARRWAGEKGLENVEFVEGDAFAHAQPPEGFDLVHERFVMTTIGRHRELVDSALALTRPGGVVAIQEADAGVLTCYPPHPAWDRLKAIVTTAFEHAGGDCFSGRQVFRLAVEAGLQQVEFRTCVVGTRRGDPLVDFLPQTILSTKPVILKHGLASEAELARLVDDCRRHLGAPTTVQTSVLVIQVWGWKPVDTRRAPTIPTPGFSVLSVDRPRRPHSRRFTPTRGAVDVAPRAGVLWSVARHE
ncbi:MAG: methyltransferase domain-containing protein [Candidatus Rokubacteria bacterium]|nr:methyltransferase domain-containing protein [Candidatus Rokubacteria bacterium]